MKITASMLSSMVAGSSTMQNNIDQSDLEPGTYTLQFSVINIKPSPNLQIPIPPTVDAIVTWKVEGQQQRRVVSVVSGASISGVCQAVDVKLIDSSANDPPYEYQVQVTLSKGLRANTQQPPQLSRGGIETVPAAGLFQFPVPQDSGVISCFVYVDTAGHAAGDIEVRMLDAVGNITASVNPAPNATQWIPLVAGTTEVDIVNHSATVGATANLIWGIDG
jgi:hypothetical protein